MSNNLNLCKLIFFELIFFFIEKLPSRFLRYCNIYKVAINVTNKENQYQKLDNLIFLGDRIYLHVKDLLKKTNKPITVNKFDLNSRKSL
jgi:hypothetical protein